MLTLLKKLTVALLLAGAPLLANAQTTASSSLSPTFVFGRTSIFINPGFVSYIQGTGAVLTDLNNNPLQNYTLNLPVVTGALDLTTSAGEVQHSGGLVVVANGVTARLENFTLDTTNPAAPVISAAIIYNDHFAGRIALFSVTPPGGFTLPLVPVNGVLQVNGFGLNLAPAAASTLSTLFNTQIPAGTPIGTANVLVVLAAAN